MEEKDSDSEGIYEPSDVKPVNLSIAAVAFRKESFYRVQSEAAEEKVIGADRRLRGIFGFMSLTESIK